MTPRRTAAIRYAAMAIESLTATDAGSLKAARDIVDRLSYELAVLSVVETTQDPTPDIEARVRSMLTGEGA